MASWKWQKNHWQAKLTLKTTFPAKLTNKNADHSDVAAMAVAAVTAAGVAVAAMAVAAVTAVEETDVAAAGSETGKDRIKPQIKKRTSFLRFFIFPSLYLKS